MLCATCDLKAKAVFMNFTLYSGFYGCCQCKSRGVSVPAERTTIRVHPYERNPRLRSNEEIVHQAEVALREGKPSYGVKGMSRLYHIMPNMVKGMPSDVMHGIFLWLSC